jgi:YD repeat-containing protein
MLDKRCIANQKMCNCRAARLRRSLMRAIALAQGMACLFLSVAVNGAAGTADPTGHAGTACSTLAENGEPSCGVAAGNPINVTNGNKYQREVDMPPLPGVLGLELVRHYNSAASRLTDAPSMMGRGWRLSYDWALRFDHAGNNATMTLVRGDGTPIGLQRRREKIDRMRSRAAPLIGSMPEASPRRWQSVGAEQGMLTEMRGGVETSYRWTEASGRRYRFNHKGWLMAIEAPSGEVLTIERELKGDITTVTDPQGRRLEFSLLSDQEALRSGRFGGGQAVVTPVGRYLYRYGGTPPAGSSVDPLRLMSRLIAMEHAGIVRHYVFEDPQHPTLLTGIRVLGAGSDGVSGDHRLATWRYDSQGRAISSERGAHEKVVLQYVAASKRADGRLQGTTILTNSFGEKTEYRYVSIAGKAHLTEVVGPGCVSCGPSNLRHEYDARARLVQTTFLAPHPRRVERLDYDELGRLVHRRTASFEAGKTGAWQVLQRFEYASQSDGDPWPLDRISVMAKPSVVPGQEQQVRFSYNQHGQVTRQQEMGFEPLLPPQQGAVELRRDTHYAYQQRSGRSLLIAVDGPLPNGPTASPADSDITRYQWDKAGNQIDTVTQPLGFTRAFAHDLAGRVLSVTQDDGVRRQVKSLAYGKDGRQALQVEAIDLRAEGVSVASNLPSVRLAMARLQMDALGHITLMTDAAQREHRFDYDLAHRLIRRSDTMGNHADTDFDAEGRVKRVGFYRAKALEPRQAMYFAYDDYGRLIRRLSPDGQLETWRYSATGSLVEHVDGDEVRTQFIRSQDELTMASLQQASDGDARLELVHRGEMPVGSHAQTERSARSSIRDDFGRVLKLALSDHGDETLHYDLSDRLISRRHADGSRVQIAYDLGGRLLEQVHLDGAGVAQEKLRLRYEGRELKEAVDTEQSTVDLRDSLGRLIGQTVQLRGLNKVFQSTRTYDPVHGQVKHVGLADGQRMVVTRAPPATSANPETASEIQSIALLAPWAVWAQDAMERYLPSTLAARLAIRMPSTVLIKDLELDAFDGLRSFAFGNGLVMQKAFDSSGRLNLRLRA